MLTHRARWLARVARWGAIFASTVLACHVLAQGLVATAIAQAPNRALTVAPVNDAPPPELARYGAHESLSVEVGSPSATLSAWVLEPPQGTHARGTIVVLHGVRLDKRSMLPVARSLAEGGFRSVLVDLRGHGRSSGKHLTYGLVESRDISELLDALEARIPSLGPIGVHGYSYGGATAIHLAAHDRRVVAAVAVSAFSSVRGAARDYLACYVPELAPLVPESWLDAAIDWGGRMAEFDPDAAAPARAIARSEAKILIVHGTADEQVPAYHADVLARSAPHGVQKLLLPGETHASVLGDASGAVRRAVLRWFERELVRRGATGSSRI